MNIRVPQALIEEHNTLLAEIEKGIQEGGLVGDAAAALKALVEPHIKSDNNVVLPVLGLLSALVHDQLDMDLGETSKILDRVKAEIQRRWESRPTQLIRACISSSQNWRVPSIRISPEPWRS